MADVLNFVDAAIAQGRKETVTVCTAYNITLARKDPALWRAMDESALVTPDGFPLTFLGNRRATRQVGRVRGTDIVRALSQHGAERRYRFFFYGGAPGVAEKMASALQRRFPGLIVVGTFSPPHQPLEEYDFASDAIRINAAQPDIIWVGLGCPKQEKWAALARPFVNASIIVGVGAAFDFLAGTQAESPPTIRRLGLEWLWRFLHEPRRLYRRVVIEGAAFVGGALWESLSGRWKRYPPPTVGPDGRRRPQRTPPPVFSGRRNG